MPIASRTSSMALRRMNVMMGAFMIPSLGCVMVGWADAIE